MQTFVLDVKKREETKKKTQDLRDKDLIPAVMYGRGKENINLMVDYNTFGKILEQAGESSLIDLKIDGAEPIKVIIQDIQIDQVAGRNIHIDFYQVNMKEKVTTDVEIKFVGEAPAEKLGGIVVKNIEEIEIKCLPGDLISKIEVDLSVLTEMDSIIHVGDIKFAETIEILNHSDDVIANVVEPAKEEEKVVVAAESTEGEEGEETKEGEGGEETKEGEEGEKKEETKKEEKK